MKREPEIGRNALTISRGIAYKGKIGQMRKDFCVAYIKHKQEVIKGIEKTQLEMAGAKGETITCRKGCQHCCVLHVDASIQEGEAIVYYLYQNESVLSNFLLAYAAWEEKVRNSEAASKKLMNSWQETGDINWKDKEIMQARLDEIGRYAMANIPCPFLKNAICSIYDVRPYTCSGLFATTPAQLCEPLNRDKARFYTAVHPDIFKDTHFYYRNLKSPIQGLMPEMVYHLLTYGLIGMPEIPGLENLPHEFMNDPEVKPILQKYLPAH